MSDNTITTSTANTTADRKRRFERDLEEGEQWGGLLGPGKSIDMQQLLRWGLANTTTTNTTTNTTTTTTTRDMDGEPSTAKKQHEPIDPKWLEILLGKSDMLRMKECVERILEKQDGITTSASSNSTTNTTTTTDITDITNTNRKEDKMMALDELELLVEDIDNAKDFVKTNLWRLLLPFVHHPEEADYRMHTLWILGTMVQNNPVVKKAFHENGFLEAVLAVWREEQDVNVLSKAVYCLSGYLKHNHPGQVDMMQRQGMTLVWNVFCRQTFPSPPATPESIGNLRRKLVFMLASLVQDETAEGFVAHVKTVVQLDKLEAFANQQQALDPELAQMMRQVLLPKLA